MLRSDVNCERPLKELNIFNVFRSRVIKLILETRQTQYRLGKTSFVYLKIRQTLVEYNWTKFFLVLNAYFHAFTIFQNIYEMFLEQGTLKIWMKHKTKSHCMIFGPNLGRIFSPSYFDSALM